MDRLITRGATVGRLTVLERCYKENLAGGQLYRWLWKCQCMCGRYAVRSAEWLLGGILTNCGRCSIPMTATEEEDMVTDYQKERLVKLYERMKHELPGFEGDCCTRIMLAENYLVEALTILGQDDIVKTYTDYINAGAD